jgi:hypothetical protein
MPRTPINGVARSKRIPLEVTPAEHAALKAWADRQGLGVGPAIRAVLYRTGALPDPQAAVVPAEGQP